MALSEIACCDHYRVKRVTGEGKLRRHLENLGFVPGEKIEVLSTATSGFIVRVKGSRVAINHEAAALIVL